jgi:hypothetical protein
MNADMAEPTVHEDPIVVALGRLDRGVRRVRGELPSWALTDEIVDRFGDIRWALLEIRRAYLTAYPGCATTTIWDALERLKSLQ